MADAKISDLTALTYVTGTYLVPVVDVVDGADSPKKATLDVVMDNMFALRDWTPTVTQSGSVAVTVNYAKWCKIGPLTLLWATLSVTGTGTGNNNIAIGGIPNDPASNGDYGNIWINDNGTSYRVGAAIYVGSSQFLCRVNGAGTAGVNPNFALANGDAIMIIAIYPSA